MSAISPAKINEERRKRVFLGTLPSDFLRPIPTPTPNHQTDLDQQAAIALQNEWTSGGCITPFVQNPIGRLQIMAVQAKLVKNYGLVTKMDPYIRLRVGQCVYETHADPSGGKTPKWNKLFHCYLSPGVNTIFLEIYDECSFTIDELIAWAQIPIPASVMKGETHEDWYPLSGKQGDDKEGMINLVLSFSNQPMTTQGSFGVATIPPVLMIPQTGGSVVSTNCSRNFAPANVFVQRPPQGVPEAQPEPIQLSITDLKQIQEMFPNIDEDVVKSVYEANRGNKDMTVNCLLQMTEE